MQNSCRPAHEAPGPAGARTDGEGLWRVEEDGETLTRVDAVKGAKVLQLVYDPTVAPAMLYVLTDSGLTVLRED